MGLKAFVDLGGGDLSVAGYIYYTPDFFGCCCGHGWVSFLGMLVVSVCAQFTLVVHCGLGAGTSFIALIVLIALLELFTFP